LRRNAALGRGRESLPQLGSGRNVRFPRPPFSSDVRQAKHPIPDEVVCVDFADASIPLSRFDQLLDKVPVRAVIRPCSHFPLLPTGTIRQCRNDTRHGRLASTLTRGCRRSFGSFRCDRRVPAAAARAPRAAGKPPWSVRHLPYSGCTANVARQHRAARPDIPYE